MAHSHWRLHTWKLTEMGEVTGSNLLDLQFTAKYKKYVEYPVKY